MTNAHLKPVERLLGDLTDFRKYTDDILKSILETVKNKGEGQFTCVLNETAVIPLLGRDLMLLKFTEAAGAITVPGKEIERYVSPELRRRERDRSDIRNLMQRLRGTDTVDEEKVLDAWMKYEDDRREQILGPREVQPRTALRLA